MFITFEGGEGTGKSTQLTLLAVRLRALGRQIITTREPGGTPEGEALRSLLVSGDTRWSPDAEALLNYAARDAHLTHVIRPALAKGQTVVGDRFMDSTRAYQAYAGGASQFFIDQLERTIVAHTRPIVTIIFDLDPETGLARAKARGNDAEDRFERKGLPFHRRLREGFLAIAKAEPARCRVIDASKSINDVEAQIWQAVHG